MLSCSKLKRYASKYHLKKNHKTFLTLAELCPYIFREFYRFGIAIGNPKRLRIFAWGSRKDIFTPPVFINSELNTLDKIRIRKQRQNHITTRKSSLFFFCFCFFVKYVLYPSLCNLFFFISCNCFFLILFFLCQSKTDI